LVVGFVRKTKKAKPSDGEKNQQTEQRTQQRSRKQTPFVQFGSSGKVFGFGSFYSAHGWSVLVLVLVLRSVGMSFPSGVLVSHGTRIFQVRGIHGTVVAAAVVAAAVMTLLRLAEKRIGHFLVVCSAWTTIDCLN
jgi:hypothetical protein